MEAEFIRSLSSGGVVRAARKEASIIGKSFYGGVRSQGEVTGLSRKLIEDRSGKSTFREWKESDNMMLASVSSWFGTRADVGGFVLIYIGSLQEAGC